MESKKGMEAWMAVLIALILVLLFAVLAVALYLGMGYKVTDLLNETALSRVGS